MHTYIHTYMHTYLHKYFFGVNTATAGAFLPRSPTVSGLATPRRPRGRRLASRTKILGTTTETSTIN